MKLSYCLCEMARGNHQQDKRAHVYATHLQLKAKKIEKTEDSCRQRVMHLYGKAAKNVNQNEVERTVTNIRESLMKQENGSVVNDNMRAEFESRPLPKGVWGLGRHTLPPPPPPARATKSALPNKNVLLISA